MSGHHHHDHDHHHDNHFTAIEARVKALETLMVQKGYVDPAALDAGWWASPGELDAEALPSVFRKALAAAGVE